MTTAGNSAQHTDDKSPADNASGAFEFLTLYTEAGFDALLKPD